VVLYIGLGCNDHLHISRTKVRGSKTIRWGILNRVGIYDVCLLLMYV